jgi:hypothetical protein
MLYVNLAKVIFLKINNYFPLTKNIMLRGRGFPAISGIFPQSVTALGHKNFMGLATYY